MRPVGTNIEHDIPRSRTIGTASRTVLTRPSSKVIEPTPAPSEPSLIRFHSSPTGTIS